MTLLTTFSVTVRTVEPVRGWDGLGQTPPSCDSPRPELLCVPGPTSSPCALSGSHTHTHNINHTNTQFPNRDFSTPFKLHVNVYMSVQFCLSTDRSTVYHLNHEMWNLSLFLAKKTNKTLSEQDAYLKIILPGVSKLVVWRDAGAYLINLPVFSLSGVWGKTHNHS